MVVNVQVLSYRACYSTYSWRAEEDVEVLRAAGGHAASLGWLGLIPADMVLPVQMEAEIPAKSFRW